MTLTASSSQLSTCSQALATTTKVGFRFLAADLASNSVSGPYRCDLSDMTHEFRLVIANRPLHTIPRRTKRNGNTRRPAPTQKLCRRSPGSGNLHRETRKIPSSRTTRSVCIAWSGMQSKHPRGLCLAPVVHIRDLTTTRLVCVHMSFARQERSYGAM